MVTKEDINAAYSRIRQLDSTIPDIVLEFMRHSSIDAMNGDTDQVVIDGPQKGKEVWQFEEGEQPKLLSNNYVVETENFKRVGDWIYIKCDDVYWHITLFQKHPIYNQPSPSTQSGVRAGAIDFREGTAEELLQVLA